MKMSSTVQSAKASMPAAASTLTSKRLKACVEMSADVETSCSDSEISMFVLNLLGTFFDVVSA